VKSLLIALLLAGPAAGQGPRNLGTPEEIVPPLIVPSGTVIPVNLMSALSTRNAKEGDGVYARTIFPVTVDNQIVIPVDSYVRGRVVSAERAGRISGTAALTLSFHTLVLPSGITLPIYGSLGGIGGTTGERRGEATVEGDTSRGADAATVATSAGTGAGIGAIGRRSVGGAAAGAGIGAAVGLGQVLLTRGDDLVLNPGTTIEIVLDEPLEP
jgi:hypothetical protein